MATQKLIHDLVGLLKTAHSLPMHIESNDSQILITMMFKSNRRQAVKVVISPAPIGIGYVVRLKSRAGVANNHQVVRSALRANANLSLGGLCLDTTTSPPSIDVVYNLVAENLQFDEFFAAVQIVGQHADAIEQRTMGTDDY